LRKKTWAARWLAKSAQSLSAAEAAAGSRSSIPARAAVRLESSNAGRDNGTIELLSFLDRDGGDLKFPDPKGAA